jgi:hypothetical protein
MSRVKSLKLKKFWTRETAKQGGSLPRPWSILSNGRVMETNTIHGNHLLIWMVVLNCSANIGKIIWVEENEQRQSALL